MSSIIRWFACCALLAGLAGVSRADFLIDAPVSPSAVPLAQVPNNRAITVGKFDPTLGTLTAVHITMSIQLLGAMGVENQSLQSGSTNVSLIYSAGVFLYPSATPPPTPAPIPPIGTPPGVYQSVLGPGMALGGTIAQVSLVPSLATFDGTLDFTGASGATISIGQPGTGLTATYNASYVAAPDLAAFIGNAGAPGTIAYTFGALGATNGAGTGGNMTFFYNGLVASNIRVQYAFVPEPSSWVLLTVGLAIPATCVWRRRGRRRLGSPLRVA